MSAQQIITELAKLSRPELERVDASLHEILRRKSSEWGRSWGESLLELAGTAQGLPADFAHNHDGYLHKPSAQ